MIISWVQMALILKWRFCKADIPSHAIVGITIYILDAPPGCTNDFPVCPQKEGGGARCWKEHRQDYSLSQDGSRAASIDLNQIVTLQSMLSKSHHKSAAMNFDLFSRMGTVKSHAGTGKNWKECQKILDWRIKTNDTKFLLESDL